jgi:hypothetical protein
MSDARQEKGAQATTRLLPVRNDRIVGYVDGALLVCELEPAVVALCKKAGVEPDTVTFAHPPLDEKGRITVLMKK